jgi:putative RecB family exonuclease
MTDRPHWSYSQLAQYLRCPLQYFFERVAKVPRPFVPSGMALGSAVHQALADYHRHLQLGRSVSRERIQETFRNAWGQNGQQTPIRYRDGEHEQEVLDQGTALVDAYLGELPPQNILLVEQSMTVPLHNSRGEFLEKPLVAVVDLLCRTDDGLLVTEFKTSGRRFNESEADTALQASCYVHAVQELHDEPVLVRYTVLVKTKKPAIQHLETVRTKSDLGRLGDVIQTVERAICAGAFYPVESPMNCSGCGFFRACREWCPTAGPKAKPVKAGRPREAALC